MNGKALRLARLFRQESRRTCIVPIDHSTTCGPIEGLKDYLRIIRQVVTGGADVVILHKGLLAQLASYPDLAKGRYIMHLSVSTVLSSKPELKVLVGSVEEAVKMGADGVSIHVNLGTSDDAEMIKDFGRISEACGEWGMPLLAMMYTHKVPKTISHITHAARLAEELGADIVKIDYPGSLEEMREIMKVVKIPVLIAGGAKHDQTENFFLDIKNALLAGARGVAIGRNVFQQENPEYFTGLIAGLVHNKEISKIRNKKSV
jgi:predicted phospho-2-dehydro-3-deoxyheptonate aldolase